MKQTMRTKSLGFIGGGRITRIFLQAFANKKVEFKSVVVYDTNTDVLVALKKQFPNIIVAETPEQVMDLIPVKPIGEHQQQITEIYQTKLLGLFEKIKPYPLTL